MYDDQVPHVADKVSQRSKGQYITVNTNMLLDTAKGIPFYLMQRPEAFINKALDELKDLVEEKLDDLEVNLELKRSLSKISLEFSNGLY